jgi:hypothetical protein
LLALVLCLVGVVGCSHTVPVQNPAPIAAAASPDATEMAILDALPRRRWTAEDVKPGRIVAFLPVKGFLVRVEIVYDANQVRIQYLNSDNLGEHQDASGQTQVHANVNKWMQTLAATIQRSMATVPSAPPPPPPASGGELPPAAGVVPGGALAPTQAAGAAGGLRQPHAPVPVAPN